MALNEYPVGTTVELSTAVTDLNGNLTDATEITLKVTDPSGALSTYTLSGAQVVHAGQGAYTYDIVLTKAGRWTYRFEASGNLVAASPDGIILAVATGT